MFEKLWNAQPTAAKRRVHFTFRDSATGDNKDPGSLTGKKASVRLDGSGSLVTTTNDVVALNQTDHLGAGYVEFTLAEFTAFGSGELLISVSGITGVKVEDAQATLYPFDPFDPGATTAQIASQVRTELTAEMDDIVSIATNGATLTAAERSAVADALLARNQMGGADGPADESVSAALAGGLFKFNYNTSTGVITFLNADDTTAFTRTLTRDQTRLIGAILGAV